MLNSSSSFSYLLIDADRAPWKVSRRQERCHEQVQTGPIPGVALPSPAVHGHLQSSRGSRSRRAMAWTSTIGRPARFVQVFGKYFSSVGLRGKLLFLRSDAKSREQDNAG